MVDSAANMHFRRRQWRTDFRLRVAKLMTYWQARRELLYFRRFNVPDQHSDFLHK